MATIIDLIGRINDFDAEDVIFAKPEWTAHAEARIFRLDEGHRIPPEATALGFAYFLEVAVARQILDEFVNRSDVPLIAKVRRVIHYAAFDA